jgi:hypothetical protein
MNPLHADFDELYRRHLCRHSQWGINALHLAAVIGVYFSLIGILRAAPGGHVLTVALLIVYLATLMRNVPGPTWWAACATIAGVLLLSLASPTLPVWGHATLILGWHRFQIWNHRMYDLGYDMSEFADKYPKGPALFLLLSVYELPVLLYFLLFDRGAAISQIAPAAATLVGGAPGSVDSTR